MATRSVICQRHQRRPITEGVEAVSQLDYLRQQGCDEVQGYFLSQALSADAFEQYLQQQI